MSQQEPMRPCPGPSRREFLRVGGLGCVGLTLPQLLRPAQAATSTTPRRGRAKNCIVIFLLGGPPQHETWDPKPNAPSNIRGEFRPIATKVPGIHVGELMPRTARHLDKICVLRAMVTGTNAHSGSGYEMLTGYPHGNKHADNLPISATDWPSMGAVVRRFEESAAHGRAASGMPAAVTLPQRIFNNGYVYWPGQNGGFLGRGADPWLLDCEPQADDFAISELALPPDVPLVRMQERRSLLSQFDAQSRVQHDSPAAARRDLYAQQALDLLSHGRARRALDLRLESVQTREFYGRHRFNQSCLLARRLIEAGVRLVQVNWPREPSEIGSGNPAWDTHSNNAGRLRTALMPPMDQAYAALLEDLHVRGLLDETLVVWMGEFGRTPLINPGGGRDHWGSVFSVALAGGGVRGGQVIGESDAIAGQPKSGRVLPCDLTATIFSCLGYGAEFHDNLGRPQAVSRGNVIDAAFQ